MRKSLRAGNRPTLLQISVSIALFFSLLVALFGAFFVIPEQVRVVEQRIDDSAIQSLGRLSAIITDPILTREYDFLYDQLDRLLAADETWKRIRILDADGLQIYPLGEWSTSLLSSQQLLSYDIRAAETRIAVIDLVVDHSAAIASSLRLTYLITAVLFGIVLVTLVAVIVVLQAAISRPVRELTHAFKAMATGDFALPLPRARSREISFLVLEFSRFRRATFGNQERLVQLKDEAERANRAKSRFLSRMSHELRTPLNSVLGFSEIALSEQGLEQEQRRRLEAISQSGHHLLELVNEILDLSRLEGGSLQVTMQPVYLPDVLDQVESMSKHFAQSHEVSLLILPLDPEVCCILADPLRLKQVLINLISNAIKYNRRGGRVYLEVEAGSESRVSIRVRDTGIGFSEEEKEKIFVPFERLSKSASSVDGTGIGLSISKRIVELMGGEIRAHSVEGVGSEFSVELTMAVVGDSESKAIIDTACCKPAANVQPLSAAADETPAPVATTAESAESAERDPCDEQGPLHILVAEDNEINQLLLKTQLESLGHSSTIVADGCEALDALQREEFDLLLTDISMPEMDGLELTRRIRAGAPVLGSHGQHLPIIACSANAMSSDRESGFGAGVDTYLTKPFQKSQLIDSIAEALASRSEHSNGSTRVSA